MTDSIKQQIKTDNKKQKMKTSPGLLIYTDRSGDVFS